MKYVKSFGTFIVESFLPGNKKKYIDIILDYIKRKSSIDLYEYDETWYIQKRNLFLQGQLFISLKTEKAIRFNWLNSDMRSEIHSIDIWEKFEFDENPDFTLEIGQSSIVQSLPEILNFIKSPSSQVNEDFTDDGFEPEESPEEELEKANKRLNRLRNPKSIEDQKRKIERLKSTIAQKEISETNSEKSSELNTLDIDVFKAIELNTLQVAKGSSNALIITGMSGVGKSFVVKSTINSAGLEKDVDYYIIKGTTTTAGLYEVLFIHRKKLIIFDDCDSVFEEKDSVMVLDAALDTEEVREVSRMTKNTTFNSIGMSDSEMKDKYEETGKLPNRFEFTGKIIFISNMSEDKFSPALISRSLHVEVNLNRKELYDRMSEIMKSICPDVELKKKEEALKYLKYITDNYPTKFDMNIRTLIHSINLRANNNGVISFGKENEMVWRLLIKKYLVKVK